MKSDPWVDKTPAMLTNKVLSHNRNHTPIFTFGMKVKTNPKPCSFVRKRSCSSTFKKSVITFREEPRIWMTISEVCLDILRLVFFCHGDTHCASHQHLNGNYYILFHSRFWMESNRVGRVPNISIHVKKKRSYIHIKHWDKVDRNKEEHNFAV